MSSASMVRIILVSGKGGVGKTTVAAATGLAASQRGLRTLVLSFDLAHSLSDSFDLDESLFSAHKGQPVAINDHLDIQEIDVQEEIQRAWKDVYGYTSALMVGGGLENVLAEEVAIAPGMEDIVALIRLNEYIKARRYDLIVLDCPPTSEALRFVSITTTINWYVRRRLKQDRRLAKIVRPIAAKISETAAISIPQDKYFGAIQDIYDKLSGVDELLRDPSVTTVRLVTNPDKMVVRETQRAYMYFCLYGITTDCVVINRLLPQGEGYFSDWAASQQEYAEKIRDYFEPVPVFKLPLQSNEVVGSSRLDSFAKLLYRDEDPAAFLVEHPAYGFQKEGTDAYRLDIKLPNAPKDKIDISRRDEELVVRIGTFKRNILLPRMIAPLATAGARMEGDILAVRFRKEAR